MSKYREGLPPIPKRLLSRPVERGYPVPYFVAQIDGGGYDFRVVDARKFAPAIAQKLCWICGQRLGSYLAFTIGPMCAINRTISEPPSHRECAEWSLKACPFLTQREQERRTNDLPQGVVESAGCPIKRQPGAVLLWITQSYKVVKAPGGNGILFQIGEPLETHWYREGRAATRAEVLESIESGYPLLEELARADGPRALQQLARQRERALKLLPAEVGA